MIMRMIRKFSLKLKLLALINHLPAPIFASLLQKQEDLKEADKDTECPV